MDHKLPQKTTQLKTDDPVKEHIPLKVGDPVDDAILGSLISKVRTVPIDTPDYVPRLSLVDLGQAEEDLKLNILALIRVHMKTNCLNSTRVAKSYVPTSMLPKHFWVMLNVTLRYARFCFLYL
jgi:hypothetical protein